jgi:pseudaminic acid cytidylyltransferase
MRVAMIPAHGGSKRVLRKNNRDFFGKPMIAWSIKVASLSGCVTGVIVSTEDEDIAEMPFNRSPKLSYDHTGTLSVVAHAIRQLTASESVPNLACCIYATAPFLHAADLQRGLQRLPESGADYAFSVTNYEHAAPVFLPRHRMLDIDTPEDERYAQLMRKIMDKSF